MIAFRCDLPEDGSFEQVVAGLREDGFVRAIIDGRMVNLDAPDDCSRRAVGC